ncbi:MAG: GNAT family N-acetyltransferase [Clostridiales bacterium]|nr:GNAT family N-acetyltransferase [Clostridiales bacterium]
MQNMEIIKITKENYSEFTEMTEWRRVGEKPTLENEFKLALDEDVIGLWNLINNDLMHIYMALVDNQKAGYISASVIPKPDKRLGTMFVDELWVPEEFRGRGIAKTLMSKVISVSEEMGLWKTRLYVDAENPSGIKCYEGVGMIRDEATCFFYQK